MKRSSIGMNGTILLVCCAFFLGMGHSQEPDIFKQETKIRARALYKNLTEKQRKTLLAYVKETIKKQPNMTREERGQVIRTKLYSIAGVSEIQKTEIEIDLWPKAIPGPASLAEGAERDTTKADSNQVANRPVIRIGHVSTPQIKVFRPYLSLANRSAIVICPGGGFHILAYDLEGTEVAQWLNHQGITAVLLKYRVPTAPHGDDLESGAGNSEFNIPKKTIGPVMDTQRALSLVRANAEKWDLDPKKIGLLGFSAGGVTSAITAIADGRAIYQKTDPHDDFSCKADFAMLIYPGDLVDKESGDLLSFAQPNEKTSPMFFVHAANDRVTCLSSVSLFAALKKINIPAELHIYQNGGHGYGLRASDEPITKWPDLALQWLKSLEML